MPSSGRENLGWKIGNKEIGINALHRGRMDVVPEYAPGRPFVYLDIAIDAAFVGRVVCELYSDAVPRTVENFRSLCTGIRGKGRRGVPLHYKGCKFHRIVPNFMIQGGDITHGDGTGGESIYGQTFQDENLSLKHNMPGMLSMANSGKHTNGSQFFITTKPCPHLDGKHVVFGRVVDGLEVVQRMEDCGQASGVPTSPVVIDDCGELKGGAGSRGLATAAALAEAVWGDEAEGRPGAGRPAKRRRAADLPEIVHVVHMVKRHAGAQNPTGRDGKPVKCTKGRAVLALTNMRKRLVMSPDAGALQRTFVEMAREHSDCEASAKAGGDLGKVAQGELPRALEDMAFGLAAGEVSEPFESPEGVHLMLRVA